MLESLRSILGASKEHLRGGYTGRKAMKWPCRRRRTARRSGGALWCPPRRWGTPPPPPPPSPPPPPPPASLSSPHWRGGCRWRRPGRSRDPPWLDRTHHPELTLDTVTQSPSQLGQDCLMWEPPLPWYTWSGTGFGSETWRSGTSFPLTFPGSAWQGTTVQALVATDTLG